MSKVFGKFGKKNCNFLRFYTKNDIKTHFSQAIFGHFERDTQAGENRFPKNLSNLSKNQ